MLDGLMRAERMHDSRDNATSSDLEIMVLSLSNDYCDEIIWKADSSADEWNLGFDPQHANSKIYVFIGFPGEMETAIWYLRPLRFT